MADYLMCRAGSRDFQPRESLEIRFGVMLWNVPERLNVPHRPSFLRNLGQVGGCNWLEMREIKVDQAWLKGERRPQMILQRKSDQIRVNPTYRTDARQSARSPLGFATVGTFLVMPAGRLEQKRLLTEISDCYKCPRTGLGFHDLNLGQMPPCTLPSR